jgi:hypothetical protein
MTELKIKVHNYSTADKHFRKYPNELLEDFECFGYIVPKGFATNFATLTPLGHLFIWKTAKLNYWATIHDYRFYVILKKWNLYKPNKLTKWDKFKKLLGVNKDLGKFLKELDLNFFQIMVIKMGIFLGAFWFGLIKE